VDGEHAYWQPSTRCALPMAHGMLRASTRLLLAASWHLPGLAARTQRRRRARALMWWTSERPGPCVRHVAAQVPLPRDASSRVECGARMRCTRGAGARVHTHLCEAAGRGRFAGAAAAQTARTTTTSERGEVRLSCRCLPLSLSLRRGGGARQRQPRRAKLRGSAGCRQPGAAALRALSHSHTQTLLAPRSTLQSGRRRLASASAAAAPVPPSWLAPRRRSAGR
jgi:hypothetical protein